MHGGHRLSRRKIKDRNWRRRCSAIKGDTKRVTDGELLRRLARAWESKYMGDWHFEVANGAFHHEGGEAFVFQVVPEKVLAFAKGDFAQTRFRLTSGST